MLSIAQDEHRTPVSRTFVRVIDDPYQRSYGATRAASCCFHRSFSEPTTLGNGDRRRERQQGESSGGPAEIGSSEKEVAHRGAIILSYVVQLIY